MATNTADTVRPQGPAGPTAEPINQQPARAARVRMRTRKTNGCARYFLAKSNSNGETPALDREVASEGEALVEALRLGVTYYAIQEFRVIPDFAGKRPQLNKEAVHGK